MREFRLETVKLGYWPKFATPWSSLVTLSLDRVDVEREDGFSCVGDRGSFPNLRHFAMVSCHTSVLSKKSITLPSLGSCQRLVSVIVSDGHFVITSQSISVAFPLSPEELVLNCATLSYSLCNTLPCQFDRNQICLVNRTGDIRRAITAILPDCDILILNEPQRDFEDWWN